MLTRNELRITFTANLCKKSLNEEAAGSRISFETPNLLRNSSKLRFLVLMTSKILRFFNLLRERLTKNFTKDSTETSKTTLTFTSAFCRKLLYSRLSLSRTCAISNFALSRTFFPIPSAFTVYFPIKCLAITNSTISNYSLFRTNFLVPRKNYSRYLELFRKCSS